MTNSLFLGFDPGGDRGFGVSVMDGRNVNATTVSSVADAIDWVQRECGSTEPRAAGIDAMLHWSDAPGGWRPSDKRLRDAYPPVRSSVLSPNGLYGAMAIGGMVLALRLRALWPNILLNETHPKVLAFALRQERHTDLEPTAAITWFAQHSGLDLAGVRTGHELDAVLSAWATREGLYKGWATLVTHHPSLIFPAGPVDYLWPAFPVAQSTDIRSPTVQTGTARTARAKQGTTAIGYINRNRQEVTGHAAESGDDHGRMYVLRCGVCSHEYGCYDSDIFQRRCPNHDRGAPGQAY